MREPYIGGEKEIQGLPVGEDEGRILAADRIDVARDGDGLLVVIAVQEWWVTVVGRRALDDIFRQGCLAVHFWVIFRGITGRCASG
jgi:hypothetical protein